MPGDKKNVLNYYTAFRIPQSTENRNLIDQLTSALNPTQADTFENYEDKNVDALKKKEDENQQFFF